MGTVQSSKTYTYGDSQWKDLLTKYNGTTLSYDAIGNLTNDGTWSYTWVHGRQLAGMSKSGTTVSYVYNADGQRISKTVNGVTTNYYYVGGRLTQMACGNDVFFIEHDTMGPYAIRRFGSETTEYYYVRNAQGDITGMANRNGELVVSYTYDAWGNVLSITGTEASTLGALNPFRYRGYVYDTETGLYYLNCRYYNPSWGRFINADGYASTGQGALGSNMFAYCNNNPVNRADPSGRFAVTTALIIGGIAVTLLSGLDMGISAHISGQSFWKGFAAGCIGGLVSYGLGILMVESGAAVASPRGTAMLTRAAGTVVSDLANDLFQDGTLSNCDFGMIAADTALDVSLSAMYGSPLSNVGKNPVGSILTGTADSIIDVAQTEYIFNNSYDRFSRATKPSKPALICPFIQKVNPRSQHIRSNRGNAYVF